MPIILGSLSGLGQMEKALDGEKVRKPGPGKLFEQSYGVRLSR